MAGLPVPVPDITPAAQPFWLAAREHRLSLPYCRRCDGLFWYPREHCPSCGGRDLEYRDVSGHGQIYSYSTVWKTFGEYAASVPYVVAYVQLDEGPFLVTNIVETTPEQLRCGLPVTAVFDDVSEQAALVRFRPLDR